MRQAGNIQKVKMGETMEISEKLAQEFGIRRQTVEDTVALIDEGNTIPFIARYRKEVTGGLSDVTLRDLDERLRYLRGLEERKAEVIRLIEEQGKLTGELKKEIETAEVLQRVEDLYKPFKQKKSTRATKAKERGLEPLADIISAQAKSGDLTVEASAFVNPEREVTTPEEALAGACDIIAERIADDPEQVEKVRKFTWETGVLTSEAADPEEKTVYDMYYDYSEPVSKIPNHRILAMNRGEKEKKLKVRLRLDTEEVCRRIARDVIINEESMAKNILEDTVADAYKRLMAPSVEREIRSELTERAEKEAVKVFAKNTENLLMVPPVKGARILSVDPGYRTGCKVAVLSETGKLLAYATIYPTEPKHDIAGAERIITKLIDKVRSEYHRHRKRNSIAGDGKICIRLYRKDGQRSEVYDRQRSGSLCLFGFKAGQRGISGSRCDDTGSYVHRPASAGSAGGAGKDIAEAYRSGSVSARHQSEPSGRRTDQCRGGLCKPRGRRSEYGVSVSALLYLRHKFRHRQKYCGLPRGKRSVCEPPAAA